MRIAVVSNDNEVSKQLAQQLKDMLVAADHIIDESCPALVLTVGGDGTLLGAFHRYAHLLDQVKFAGVHTGHLGFYTDWRDYELTELVESLREDGSEDESVSYPLLKIEVTYRDPSVPVRHLLALNESNLKRINTSTMVTDVYIRDELFESFRGDGLCVSTPTGSTAYNKSIGGAVLHPSINALQLTEIASLNNRVYRTLGSPLILASGEWVRLELQDSDDYLLTVDQMSIPHANIKNVRYEIAEERIHFASYRHTHFWRRVKDAFIGDL